jgi:protein-L-isoaspartate(D-aspartate) O-methyltransferase
VAIHENGPMSEGDELAQSLAAAVTDRRVLDAIAATPRERFLPRRERERAYENVALPIACGQTISQPLVVGRMLQVLELQPEDRVLDVGTGSGYHAALLARLARHVWTIERIGRLAQRAERTLAGLGLENVTCLVGDGCRGLPDQAPFDAINVAAAGAEIPARLEAQLAPGGRLVVPVGGKRQYLVLVRREGDEFIRQRLEPVRFVPLISDF